MENFEEICLPWSNWKIVKYLGGGAYGEVYEIERTISGIQEKAALKIISRPKEERELETDYQNGFDEESIVAKYTEILQEYVNEYKLMKELQGQSNIVNCDDLAIEENPDGIGGKIYIRMELLTPLQKVTKERLLSEKEVVKLGKDICMALILCESRNIIHRDIKPDNIMISKFGNFKLGDFGVSKVMDHTTGGTMTGTEGYIAPEVLHMEKYGKEVDIYSLGIVMYWLLNNRKMPFLGADEKLTSSKVQEAFMRRYRGEKLPAPKNGSTELKQIVLKACEYQPKDRYLTAQEMYDELDELQRGGNSREGTSEETGKSKEKKEEPEGKRREIINELVCCLEMVARQKSTELVITEEDWEDNDWEEKGVTIGKDRYAFDGGQTAGNSWRGFGETIGKSGGEKEQSQSQKAYHEELVSETIGVEKGMGKAKESETDEQVDPLLRYGYFVKERLKINREEEAEQLLEKISVEPGTENGAGIVFLDFKGKREFEEWMEENKKLIPCIDNHIRKNAEFAKRLYYRKCPNKRLLNYMKQLNPDVVEKIKSNSKQSGMKLPDSEGRIFGKEYEWDEHGNVVKLTDYWMDGRIFRVAEYGEDEHVTKVIDFEKDGSGSSEYIFNEQGIITGLTKLNARGDTVEFRCYIENEEITGADLKK